MDWFFIYMMAFCIMIVVIGIGGIIYNRKINRADWTEVEAQIYDYSREWNGTKSYRVPVCKYTYNGTEYIQESLERIINYKGEIGGYVKIGIEPINPGLIRENVTLRDF